jgi:hypothetical protein
MSFLKEIKEFLGHDPDSITQPDQVSEDSPLFVYVRIPGDIDPVDRHELFAEPLQSALENEGWGTVTGGGSLVSDEDGETEADFCGIDVNLYEAVAGLQLLRRELIRLNAPPGTVLIYELNGNEWEEPVHRPEN